MKAFNFNIRKLNKVLAGLIDAVDSPTGKLKAITGFYRNYHILETKLGGCPILNVSVDSNHQNEALLERSREVILKMKERLASIIREGARINEFKPEIDAERYASLIFTQIEGSAFMAGVLGDDRQNEYMMDHIDYMIDNEMKK